MTVPQGQGQGHQESRDTTDDSLTSPSDTSRHDERPVKLVVRHLPPDMAADDFWSAVRVHGGGDERNEPVYRYMTSGHVTAGATRAAYVALRSQEAGLRFANRWHGHVFTGKSGREYCAVVEWATNQTIPKQSKHRDKRENTFSSDKRYLLFLRELQAAREGEAGAAGGGQGGAGGGTGGGAATKNPVRDILEEIEAREKRRESGQVERSTLVNHMNSKMVAGGAGKKPVVPARRDDDEGGVEARIYRRQLWPTYQSHSAVKTADGDKMKKLRETLDADLDAWIAKATSKEHSRRNTDKDKKKRSKECGERSQAHDEPKSSRRAKEEMKSQRAHCSTSPRTDSSHSNKRSDRKRVTQRKQSEGTTGKRGVKQHDQTDKSESSKRQKASRKVRQMVTEVELDRGVRKSDRMSTEAKKSDEKVKQSRIRIITLPPEQSGSPAGGAGQGQRAENIKVFRLEA